MKNAPSKLLSLENSCTFKMMISDVQVLNGDKSFLNECIIQKLSRFEYLKIYTLFYNYFVLFVHISLCNSLKKNIWQSISVSRREMKKRGT